MFRQLRLKMTLLNAGVTILLFIILISGVFVLLHYNSQQTTSFFLDDITKNVIEKNMRDLPHRHSDEDETEKKPGPGIFPMPRPSFFFVELNASGQILHKSSFVTVNDETLTKLCEQIQQAEKSRDDITFANINFAYLRTAMKNGQTLIVLNDASEEKTLLLNVLYNLLLVGVFCTILSFGASYFMAKHAIRPIQYATNQQKNFVANASHELRTPITIIQANLDILNGSPPGDTVENNRKWLDNIQDETTRMTELINALLFLARADANQQLLEKEYLNLNEVVAKTLASFQLLAAEKGIELSASAESSKPAFGDPARIRQLLTILIDNAMHHTLPGGKIMVKSRTAADASLLEVSDTGEGIGETDINRIFDRFYQADSSRNHSGAGLGLSMAKWIVAQHKGTIRVESALGKGTNFFVSLPHEN